MANKTPDAIALLIGDHRKVAGLFKKFEKAKGPQKAKLAHDICLELLDEAHVEHDSAKVLIADVLANRLGSAFYDAKIKVLSELIKHHVKEEEQRGGLFTQARKAKVDLVALRERMEASKEELAARYKRSIPTPTVRALRKPRVKAGKPVGR